MKLPEKTRDYHCHHMNGSRWEHYNKRTDDIVVATSYKAGTTWTRGILANMLFLNGDLPAPPCDDMLEDLDGEMRRMAAFLEIDVSEQQWPRVVDACTFAGMKKRAEFYAPDGGRHWKGGAHTFMNKGTNGRWKGVLTEEELAQYDAACEKALTPDCRAWLESGRSTLG